MLGAKGFGSDAIRGVIIEDHDAWSLIPNRATRTEPWPWDVVTQETQKQRKWIERAFAKAKQSPRFAARYEKLKEVYLGLMRLVFGFIEARYKAALTVDTP